MGCEVLPVTPDLLRAHRGEAGGAERRWSCVCAQGGCGMYCMASQLVGALLCTPLYLASGGCCLGYCQGAAAPPCPRKRAAVARRAWLPLRLVADRRDTNSGCPGGAQGKSVVNAVQRSAWSALVAIEESNRDNAWTKHTESNNE